jgi:hypothetical protein
MIWPTIPFKPHVPRCPKCNQYLPDRCTCNGMSIEQRRNSESYPDEVMQARATPWGLGRTMIVATPTGRRTGLHPALAVAYGQPAPKWQLHFIGTDFGDPEERVLAVLGRHPDSPAGWGCGQVDLDINNTGFLHRTASGNARQRRRQIRIWKRQGFTVTQFNVHTRERITR